jgi:hypothetical protein
LLVQLNYSLKANVKRFAGASHPARNQQFEYIERQKQAFLDAGLPVISVDTKKKELIGNFKNAGRTWSQEADEVNDHDFAQDALGKAIPYGIYDLAPSSWLRVCRHVGRYPAVRDRDDRAVVAGGRSGALPRSHPEHDLNIQFAAVCPRWNYTIRPRAACT